MEERKTAAQGHIFGVSEKSVFWFGVKSFAFTGVKSPSTAVLLWRV
jgi:hypothetical protein